MKLLITGASGFLGGHLAELCVRAGHDVRALVRRTSHTELLERLGVELVIGDLKDEGSLRRAVEGVDAVAHLASTTGGPPEEYVAATVEGTRALLNAAEGAGVGRFVHVSSVAVCSFRHALADQPAGEDLPYEDDPRFLSHYTRSKIAAEAAALRHSEEGSMDVIVLRPAVLYGPRGRWSISRLGYALGANCYAVIGPGRTELPVCYVRNCAGAILTALENREVTLGVFNIVDDEGFTARQYLSALKRRARPGLRIVPVPYLAARTLAALGGLALAPLGRRSPVRPSYLMQCRRRLRYANRRAKEILGWCPETDRAEALEATVEYFAEKEQVTRRADLRRLGRAPSGAPALTTCIIGCGGIAEAHVAILGRMENARVLALCDVDAGAAARLADRSGVERTYTDAAKMLQAERPDVVHVLSPPQCHAEHARLAAEHGCHVLVEKPMAVDATEAERMVECAERHGVKLCVDHNRLYEPRVVQARSLVESGALGRLLWVEAYYGFNLAGNPASGYMAAGGAKHWTFGLPGGLYENLAPHPLCLALEWLGEPHSLAACARDARVLAHQPTDELRVLLRTPGPCGLVTVSLAAGPRQEYLRLVGTRMSVTADLLNRVVTRQSSAGPLPKALSRAWSNGRSAAALLAGTVRAAAQVLTGRWDPYKGMDLLVREFYRAVQCGDQPPVTPAEGVQVMRIMDRIWKQIGTQGCNEASECV